MSECAFEIEKHIAVLSGESDGVRKEVNFVSWNGKPPVIDVRTWNSKGRAYKGVTMTISEAKALKEALNGLEMLK